MFRYITLGILAAVLSFFAAQTVVYGQSPSPSPSASPSSSPAVLPDSAPSTGFGSF
jgi:hypothetical protein